MNCACREIFTLLLEVSSRNCISSAFDSLNLNEYLKSLLCWHIIYMYACAIIRVLLMDEIFNSREYVMLKLL